MKNLMTKLLGMTALVGIFAGALAAFPGWMDPPSRNNTHDPRNHPHHKVPQIDPGIAGPTSTPPPVGCRVQPAQNALVQANNAFAVDLYGALARTLAPSDNLAYSPFSVSTALDMAWSGAAGQTASQMATVLHLQGDPAVIGTQVQQLLGSLASSAANHLTFTVGDSLWLNSNIAFSSAYLAQMRQYYGATAQSLSFADGPAVVSLINQWVADSTDQLIKGILGPRDVQPTSVAFLLNAVLLEAGWQSPFLAQNTAQQAFTCGDGSVTTTAMMKQTNQYYYAEGPDAQVLEMPYQGGDFSLLVLLPTDGSSLTALESGLTPAGLDSRIRGLCPQLVAVKFPKLSLALGPVNLVQELRGLGMTDAFTGTANFSPMSASGNSDFHIEIVKHAAVVQVDEGGIKAAAVTVIGYAINAVSGPPPNLVQFNANHPFLFLVRQNSTGSILFMGRVNNPNQP